LVVFRKEECKRVLTKHFTQDIDYKIITNELYDENLAPQVGGASLAPLKHGGQDTDYKIATNEFDKNLAPPTCGASLTRLKHGGQNKEKILMTINTFKKLCLKSNTKKADEIHDYFIMLEELTQETINEESSELRNQLQLKDLQMIQNCQQIRLDSYNKKCVVYLIKITNTLFKFGNTYDIIKRFSDHRREINQEIQLIFCIESKNNTLLEQKLKDFLKTTDYRKTLTIKKKNQTELIEINNITIIENLLRKLNKDMDNNLEVLKVQENILALQLRLAEIENKYLISQTGNLEQDLLKMNQIIQIIQTKKRKVYLQARKQRPQVKERDRLLERERYKIISKTEEYKKKHKEYTHKYYEKNKEELKIKSSEKRKQKSKTAIANSIEEKNKFFDWCKKHIILNEINEHKDFILPWTETFKKYLDTSDRIGSIYKKYIEDFIKDTFPNINNKYSQFCVKRKSIYGWKNLNFTE